MPDTHAAIDIHKSRATIVACLDSPAVLDALNGMPELTSTFRARTASDELWLITSPDRAANVLGMATVKLNQAGSAGLAADISDAWTVWTVVGDDVKLIWARLSQNPIPPTSHGHPAFVQGAVASVPTKAIVLDSFIHFITPSTLAHHLPHRILHGCNDLSPTLLGEADFLLTSGELTGVEE